MGGVAQIGLLSAFDKDHIGAHVRQQHPGVRTRPYTKQLDELDTVQWPHA